MHPHESEVGERFGHGGSSSNSEKNDNELAYPFQFGVSTRIAYRARIFAEVDLGIKRVASVVGGAFPQVVIQHAEIANAYSFVVRCV